VCECGIFFGDLVAAFDAQNDEEYVERADADQCCVPCVIEEWHEYEDADDRKDPAQGLFFEWLFSIFFDEVVFVLEFVFVFGFDFFSFLCCDAFFCGNLDFGTLFRFCESIAFLFFLSF